MAQVCEECEAYGVCAVYVACVVWECVVCVAWVCEVYVV